MVKFERNCLRFADRSRSCAVPGYAALLIAIVLIASCSFTSVTDTGPGRKPIPLNVWVEPVFKDVSPRAKPADVTRVKDQQDEQRAADALTRKGYVKIGTVSGRSVQDPSLYSTVSAVAAQKGGDVILLWDTQQRGDVSTTRTTAGTGSYYRSGGELVRGSSSTGSFSHYTFYSYSGSVWRHDPPRAAAKIELLEGVVDPDRLERFFNSEAGKSAGILAKDLNDLIAKNVGRINGRSFKLLVKAGANPRLAYGMESLPLMALAVYKGNVSLAQALLDSGEPFAITGTKFSCSSAISYGYLQSDHQCSSSPDFAAIVSGNPKMLEFVAQRIPMKFRGDKGYMTPLQYAALQDQPSMIEKLLQMPGNGYKRDDLNCALRTALPYRTKAVSMLLRKGADPNAKDEDHTTILMNLIDRISYDPWGSDAPEIRVVNMLLDAGSDPNGEGAFRYTSREYNSHCTPLDVSVSKFGDKSLVAKTLRARGAKPMSAQECSKYRQSLGLKP